MNLLSHNRVTKRFRRGRRSQHKGRRPSRAQGPKCTSRRDRNTPRRCMNFSTAHCPQIHWLRFWPPCLTQTRPTRASLAWAASRYTFHAGEVAAYTTPFLAATRPAPEFLRLKNRHCFRRHNKLRGTSSHRCPRPIRSTTSVKGQHHQT